MTHLPQGLAQDIFQRQLAVLGRSSPRPTTLIPPLGSYRRAPRPAPRVANATQLAAQRRRRVFCSLVGAVVVTMVAAWLVGGLFVPLQLLADVLLVAYVVMRFVLLMWRGI